MPERDDKPLMDGALIVDAADDFDDRDDYSDGEPGDGKAEQAAEVLQELLSHMDLEARVHIRADADRIELDVSGEDTGRVIGKKGQTLDALQFLVNKIVNRFPDGRRHVVVDCGDYRERHDKNLVNMAKRQAKRAVERGKVVTLDPMSARDRRVVHLSLAKFPGVTTKSNGEGIGRRLQIIPANTNPRRRRRRD